VTADDPDLAAAVEAAVDHLARRLKAVSPLADPRAAAAEYVAWLRDQGWRPPLKPPPDWKHLHDRPASPPTAEWREAKAKITGEQR
jgi:hypothetical protein